MSIEFINAVTSKPIASRQLVDLLKEQTEWEGRLWIGYPSSPISDDLDKFDAVWVTKDRGIIAFDIVEGETLECFQSRQDLIANNLEVKLRSTPKLLVGRNLSVPIHTMTFSPVGGEVVHPGNYFAPDSSYTIATSETVIEQIAKIKVCEDYRTKFNLILSVFDNVVDLRRSHSTRPAMVSNPLKRGEILSSIEQSTSTLDHSQSKAILETVDGVQRIRGLAGSGKTVVLAMKAAYLHAEHPDWLIAVTFATRSLKPFFKRLIKRFHLIRTGVEPDWQNLRVTYAWGGQGTEERSGIYHRFCLENEVTYLDFSAAKQRFSRDSAFDGSCKLALTESVHSRETFDAILVDEAQDLPSVFLKLCFTMLKSPKRLVYAYDELQNLGEESLPSPEVIFGNQDNGQPPVDLSARDATEPRKDVLLARCYRQPRQILITAHALGFGIYRQDSSDTHRSGLVQMFDEPDLWESVGYQVKEGQLAEGKQVTLVRTKETSPLFLEEHSPTNDLIQFEKFESELDQANRVVEGITENLEEDGLRHEDILIVNCDPISTPQKVGLIRGLLAEKGIHSHIVSVDYDTDVFLRSGVDSVVCTSIYRAKGNEAAMVYVINADDCQDSSSNLVRSRNRLFTAITRSKAWIRVYGVGEKMNKLIEEYQRLAANDFELKFRYPNKQEREQLREIHGDRPCSVDDPIEQQNRNLQSLVEEIEQNNTTVEKLDEALLSRVQELISRRSN